MDLDDELFHWGSSYRIDDPVLSHPSLQRLRYIKQLGQIDAIHNRATNSRYDHSVEAARVARKICAVLKKDGRLPDSEIDIIQYTKLHDCGHPPFSHAVEYVLREFTTTNHKERAVQILDSDERDPENRTLRNVLEETGTNVDNLRRLLQGHNGARAICSDKTLGADKLAYTRVDADACDFNQRPPSWFSLVPYVTYFERLGLDIGRRHQQQDDPLSLICASQAFYFRMYTDVYLSPESLALERHIQKAVELSIHAGILKPEEIWDLVDDVLVDRIRYSSSDDPRVREAKSQISRYSLASGVYQRAVSFILEQFLYSKYPDEDAHPIDEEFKTRFLTAFNQPSLLTTLEEKLEREIGIPVICSLLPDPEKIKPADVPLYVGARHVHNLQDYRPSHYKMLNEHAECFFAIRLLVPPKEQDNARRKHGKIAGAFYEIANDLMRDAA